ncbi:MAG: DUF1835 domain-containing protein [Acidobacteriota bacterium]|nr:DUF1835 domain-containing protein [Acidobacteriota bacterium]
MKKIHVLPGDAPARAFGDSGIEGETVICRECLVEGGVRAVNLEDFWTVRAGFIKDAYGESEEKYFREVVGEFKKLENLAPGTQVNLWFEYELFCQVNMWFCLSLLQNTKASVYRVAPVVRAEEDVWKGFGNLSAGDLEKCFARRVEFTGEDIRLGAELWKAFQNADYGKLEKLSETESDCFPRLKEVCRAEIEKDFRPRKVLREIIEDGASDFAREIFPEFSARAGVYGFGDAQVKRILRQK